MTRTYLMAMGLAAILLAGGKPPIDPAGAEFGFEAATVQLRTRAMHTPKAVDVTAEPLQLALGDGTFTLVLDDESELTGTWTRKSPSSRKLRLELDADGEAALLASLGQRVADQLLPPQGQMGPAELLLQKARISVRLITDKQTGAVSAKLLLRARVEGGLQPAGPDGVPLKSRVRILGQSLPVDL